MPRPLYAASGSFQKRCRLLPLLAVGVAEEQIRLTTGIRERNQRRQGSCPAEWLALLLDREATHRSTQRFIKNLDYRAPRRLDKTLFQRLAAGRWIGENRNLLVTGPCGVGKSWLSCSLAQNACCNGFTVHYARVPRLFADRELPELVHGAAQRIGQRLNLFPPVGKIVAEDADKRFDAVLCSRFVERLVVLPTVLSQTPVAV